MKVKTPEEELKELGITCAYGFEKLSPEGKRLFLVFQKMLKIVEIKK